MNTELSNKITSSDYLNYFQAVNEVNIFVTNGLNRTMVNAKGHLKPIQHTWRDFFHSLFEHIHTVFSSQARKLKQHNTSGKVRVLKNNIEIINNLHEKYSLILDSNKTNCLSLQMQQFTNIFNPSIEQFKKFNTLTQTTWNISRFVQKIFGCALNNPRELNINIPEIRPLFEGETTASIDPFFLKLQNEIWKGDYQLSKDFGYLAHFNSSATHYLMNKDKPLSYNLSMLDHWGLLNTLKNQTVEANTFDFSTQNCYRQAKTYEELCDLLDYVTAQRARLRKNDDSQFLHRYSVAIEKLTNILENNYEQYKDQFSAMLEKAADSVPPSEKKIIKYNILYQFLYFYSEFKISENGKKLSEEFTNYDRTLKDAYTVDEKIIDELFSSLLKIVNETVKRCDS